MAMDKDNSGRCYPQGRIYSGTSSCIEMSLLFEILIGGDTTAHQMIVQHIVLKMKLTSGKNLIQLCDFNTSWKNTECGMKSHKANGLIALENR